MTTCPNTEGGGQAAPPFHGPVRVADEIDRIIHLIQHYTALPNNDLAVLLACWIVNTYTFQHFRYCGYVALRSATPQCGKTRLLRLIGSLAKGNRKPIAFPTAAVIFRCGWEVMLLDEVDQLRNGDKETFGALLAVLNFGFERGGAIVRNERIEGTYQPTEFPVYGPKAFAGIEGLADTLSDRTFHIQMERAKYRQPRMVMRKMDDELTSVRLKREWWECETATLLVAAYDDLPDQHPDLERFDDRFQDIAEPLIILATMADAERPTGPLILPRLLEGLRVAAGRRAPSVGERLLLIILKMMEDKLGPKDEMFLPSQELFQACGGGDGTTGISSTTALASFLKRFDLSPREASDGKCRGYWITRSWIEHWKARYGGKEGGLNGMPPAATCLSV